MASDSAAEVACTLCGGEARDTPHFIHVRANKRVESGYRPVCPTCYESLLASMKASGVYREERL